MESQGWSLMSQSDRLGVYKVTEEIIEPGRLWKRHSHLLLVDPEMRPAGKQYSQKGSGLRMRGSKTLFSFFPTMSHSKSFACFFFLFPTSRLSGSHCSVLTPPDPADVNDTLCDMVHRPLAMSQACNTEPYPPRYVWSSAPCRESRLCIEAEGGGTQGDQCSPFSVQAVCQPDSH